MKSEAIVDMRSEMISILNGFEWKPMGDGIIAEVPKEYSVEELERGVTFGLSVQPVLVETPTGCEIAFYRAECARLVAAGLHVSNYTSTCVN